MSGRRNTLGQYLAWLAVTRQASVPVAPLPRHLLMPDAVLDHWGATYLANPRLAGHGVTFEHFLTQPVDYLLAIGLHAPPTASSSSGSAEPFYPLLPAQERAAVRADALALLAERLERQADAARLVCRDGRLIEPLHHHRHTTTPGPAPRHNPWRLRGEPLFFWRKP